jgi:hypothetical protein
VPGERLVVALHAGDFASEAQLDGTIETLRRETGVWRYAVHDVGGLVDLVNRQ